jgi:hypothetical protein
MEDKELERLRREVENAYYGRNRDRRILVVFGDLEGAESGYRAQILKNSPGEQTL